MLTAIISDLTDSDVTSGLSCHEWQANLKLSMQHVNPVGYSNVLRCPTMK